MCSMRFVVNDMEQNRNRNFCCPFCGDRAFIVYDHSVFGELIFGLFCVGHNRNHYRIRRDINELLNGCYSFVPEKK